MSDSDTWLLLVFRVPLASFSATDECNVNVTNEHYNYIQVEAVVLLPEVRLLAPTTRENLPRSTVGSPQAGPAAGRIGLYSWFSYSRGDVSAGAYVCAGAS